MPRLFFGNFDFEEQLHAAPGQQRPVSLERLVNEMVFGFLGVATPEDRIWCPGRVSEPFLDVIESIGLPRDILVGDASPLPRGLTLEPWGWSREAVRFGERVGVIVNPPSLDVVRHANSREFSVALEKRLDPEREIAKLCLTMGEVLAFSERFSPDVRWGIKANWSHAARERILRRGPPLDDAAIHWIRQRLARDGVVCCELWLDRISEYGIQWQIPQYGEPQLIAITELLVDARGQYLGTKCVPALPDGTHPIADTTRPAVRELAHQGYYGPVGIDVMQYSHDGMDLIRPLQDINARWTMGRLAVGWFDKASRFASPHRDASSAMYWLHGTKETADSVAPASQLIATSPDHLDDRPVRHQTWLAVTPG